MQSTDTKRYEIVFETPVIKENESNLIDQIEDFNLRKNSSFLDNIHTYGFFIKNGAEILGGVIGKTWMGSLYIHRIFLREEIRNQGYGSQLLKCAEDFGRQHKCTLATLESLSFQEAVGFYKKNDYELVYADRGYDNNTIIYFMRKKLA